MINTAKAETSCIDTKISFDDLFFELLSKDGASTSKSEHWVDFYFGANSWSFSEPNNPDHPVVKRFSMVGDSVELDCYSYLNQKSCVNNYLESSPQKLNGYDVRKCS